MPRLLLAAGALVMALAVGLGAYASHATRAAAHPEAPRLLQIAVLYMLVHGLALVGEGILALRSASRWLYAAAALHAFGILLFCGSLWWLALAGAAPGMAPFGGTCFILGWVALALHARHA